MITLLTGCDSGYGTPGLSGTFTADRGCGIGLAQGDPRFWLPWREDLVIAGTLVGTALAIVLATSLRNRLLAVLALPVLLVAGLLMGRRAWTERAMERMARIIPESGLHGHEEGWVAHISGHDILFPEPDGYWLPIAFLGGLVALIFACAVWTPRRAETNQE
ncbi:MAG: hypothetical protein GEU98_04320 [Pseudonocardiaceae bacterium]|nr:hypothetical protein [Pseudonocardiaceae bacterium]